MICPYDGFMMDEDENGVNECPRCGYVQGGR